MDNNMNITGYKDKHEFERNGIKSVVYLMDCMKLMEQVGVGCFDLACIDPPYGIGDEKLTQGGTWATKYKKGDAAWDIKPTTEYWKQLFKVSKNQIVWGANYFMNELPPSRAFIIWDKIAHLPTMADCEFAWVSIDSNAKICKVLRATQSDETRLHICQKPIKLYDWIFSKYATQTQTILDTHLGSGSSRIAADKAKLHFTGCELDPEYFYAHCKRFDNYSNQLQLF
jgi:site-specific DNA-methyltransferase (adenine-specific)